MNNRRKPFNLVRFVTENWFLTVFAACIGFVVLVSFFKLFVAKDQFVYAKVKVSQGLWWASTNRPPVWFLKAFSKGDVQSSLTGKSEAEILAVRYYPYYTSSQYDIFLTLKLKVSGNPKTGTVNFNRSTLAVGSPVDLAFPRAEVSGTVIALNPGPFREQLVEKTITIVKSNAYQWEYDAINIGDNYHDGETKVLEITDKQVSDNPLYGLESFGSASERSTVGLFPEPRKIITVTARVKVRPYNGTYVYGEEQELRFGRIISLSTNNFSFQDFQIASVN